MWVLTRKAGEKLRIGSDPEAVVVTIHRISGDRAVIAVENATSVVRGETAAEIRSEQERAAFEPPAE